MTRESKLRLSDLGQRWASAEANALARAVDERRAQGREVLDLITSNWCDHGLEFPPERLAEIVDRAVRGIETVRRYAPDPRGQLPAREAIAEFYRRRGVEADPSRILLTAGTSLGYLFALRLLVNSGEEILVPSPGYPLFDDICAVCGIGLRLYHLSDETGRWRPDLDEIEFQITGRTRAIMVISPHNPTGCVFSAKELDGLGAICRKHGLPLVFDEVFSEFLSPGLDRLPRPHPGAFPLTVTLNGISKMLAAPAWKIAWMKVDGDAARRDPFLRSLEHLSDTFLPVSELAQAMIPALMEAGDPAVISTLAREFSTRRCIALEALPSAPPEPEGGVYLCCPLPEREDDEEFVLRLLRECGVLVHPGHFYNLPRHFVMTCVARPETLREGIARIAAALRDPRT